MSFVVAFVLVHVLCWGTIGAALAPRAGLPTWAGVLISAALPGLGMAILAGLGIWGGNRRPSVQTNETWLRLSWVGVAAGVMVVAASWLPWIEFSVTGEAGSSEADVWGFAVADYVGFPILLSVVGALVTLFAWLAGRRGQREWLVGVAFFAWFPAAVGASSLLSEAVIDKQVNRVNVAGNVLADQGVAEVGIGGDYSIGSGPYLALLGGLIALGWAFAWCLRRSDAPILAGAGRRIGIEPPESGFHGESTFPTQIGTVGPAIGTGYAFAAPDDWSTTASADPAPATGFAQVRDEWTTDEGDVGGPPQSEAERWW